MRAFRWFIGVSLILTAAPGSAMCPIPPYNTDANDLVQIKGTVYDNAGNETKVKCTSADASAAYHAFTGGASDPPSRAFAGLPFDCPALDYEAGGPFGPTGADVQIVKNGKLKNACAFVGHRDAGSGYPRGISMNSVLKFDAAGNFKSEKGTLTYNLTSGSFVGTFKVVARP